MVQHKTSLFFRVMAAMILVGLLSGVVMMLQGLHCAREALLQATDRRVESLLSRYSQRLEDWRQEREADLRLIAAAPSLQHRLTVGTGECSAEELAGYLNQVQQANSDVLVVAAYDSDWKLLTRSTEERHKASELVEDQLRTRLQRATAVTWGRSSHWHEDGSVAVHIGTPVFINDKRVGYIVAALRFNMARINHRRLDSLPAASVRIVGRTDKRYVSVPFGDQDLIGQPADVPVGMLADPDQQLFTYRTDSGVDLFGAARKLDEWGWILVAEVEQADAMAPLDFLIRRSLITGVVVLLLVIGGAWLLAQSLGRPLRELVRVCRQRASGESRARLSDFRASEASDVANSFNTMLDELDRTQQQLVQASTLAAVGELSASLVHEMRNPLNTIQINLEALRKKFGNRADFDEMFELADRQTRRLQGMLNELLVFGAPIQLQKTETEIVDLVDEVLQNYASAAQEKQVNITVPAAAEQLTTRIDREQFRRVLSNLIDNALQMTEPGGRIDIKLGRSENKLVVEVADTGVGVPPEMRDRIFQPFFTTREKGIGLGLPLVRKIVRCHGGEIELENNEPGTRFRITIPME